MPAPCCTPHDPGSPAPPAIEFSQVVSNVSVCREHYRLTLRVAGCAHAAPGQFVQISPAPVTNGASLAAPDVAHMPLLPRAFSIGGLRERSAGRELDILYRVVGVATRWMRSLRTGDSVRLLGPLGHGFCIPPQCRTALLVIGGIGLPPLLFLAHALHRAAVRTIAFLGAQSADLIPLELLPGAAPVADATRAVPCARPFSDLGIPIVLGTDDGTLGYPGTVVAALAAYAQANPMAPAETVVYTCGPQRMMQATAAWAARTGTLCYVCMERPMACGLGTCQSCIVTVRAPRTTQGSRYALCCSEGPVFDAAQIVWDDDAH